MPRLFIFFALLGVVLCSHAADTEKHYSRWVQNAALIYVYNKKGTLQLTVPITHGATVHDVRAYLIDEYVINDNFYSLSPLYNGWWRLKSWWIYSTEKIDKGSIKDAMQQYNTQSFWIQRKPRKQDKLVRIESDSE